MAIIIFTLLLLNWTLGNYFLQFDKLVVLQFISVSEPHYLKCLAREHLN